VDYENFRSLPGERWERDRVVAFDVDIPRPGLYTFMLYVRHTPGVEQANIACLLTLSRGGVTLAERRAEFLLSDSLGRWTGDGAFLRTLKTTAGEPLAVDSAGVLRVEVSHRMKNEELKGIKDIGLHVYGEE
jgi:gliding motility-associated lipoprotein GldH